MTITTVTTPPPAPESTAIGIKKVQINNEVSYSYQIDLVKQIRYIGAKEIENPKNKKKKIKKVRFITTDVKLGRMAVVTRGDAAYDHDGFAEVYLPGEMIIKRNLADTKEWKIIEIASNPGSIEVRFTSDVLLLEENSNEFLQATITYNTYVEDPIKLLSQNSDWDSPAGQIALVTSIENIITNTIKNFSENDIHIWSAEDFNLLADKLKTILDSKLNTWGLRIRPDFIATREIPEFIYDLIFSCVRAERSLNKENAAKFRELELSSEEIVKIQSDSLNNAVGLGLFNFLTSEGKIGSHAKLVQHFSSSKEYKTIAGLIDKIKQGDEERRTALFNQIIRNRFLNPKVSNGEWLDLASKRKQLETY